MWRGLRRLYARAASALGTTLVLIFLLLALLGPWLAPYGKNEQIFTDARQPPSAEHWFGTDRLGRDVFSRVIYGTRISLRIGFVTVSFAIIVGTLLGAISGYVGGTTDNVIQRVLASMPDGLYHREPELSARQRGFLSRLFR